MSAAVIASVCGYLGGSLSTAMSVPQIRVIRRGDATTTAGISRDTWLFIVLGCLTFIAYGVQTRSTSMVVANTMTLVPALLITVALSRMRRLSLRPLLAWSAGLLVFCIAFAHEHWLVGTVGSLVCLWQRQPQLNELWRRRAQAVLGDGGVSPLTWAMSIACTLAWIAYAIAKVDWILIANNVVLTAQAAGIFVLTRQAERAALESGHPELVVAG